MSYRTFKHLLGETSLERKCRFIFGGGIFALVTTSFYLYGQKTEALLMNQSKQTARRLVTPAIKDKHYQSTKFVNRTTSNQFEQLSDSLKQQDDLPNYDGRVIDPYQPEKADPTADGTRDSAERNFVQDFERGALQRFLRSASDASPPNKPNPLKPYSFGDGASMEEWRTLPGKTKYVYAQAVTYKSECIGCNAFR